MLNISLINKNNKEKDNILFLGLSMLLLITPLAYFSELRGGKELKDCVGQILIFLLFIIWVIRKPKDVLRVNNLNKLVFLFMMLIFISFAFSQNYYLSFLGLNKWLSYMLVYIMAISVLNNTENIKKIFYVLVLVGFLTSLYGIINYYFHFDPIIETLKLKGRQKMLSTFGNPNYLSSFLGPLLPLNFYLILTEENRKFKIGSFASFAVIYTTLLFAKTRGVFLGLIFIVFFITFCFKKYLDKSYLLKKRKIIIILLILIITLTFIFSGDIPFADEEISSVGSRFKKDSLLSHGNYKRIMMWLITWDMIKDSPIVGKGIGTYRYMYPKYQKKFLAKNTNFKILSTWTKDAHNEYLQLGAESGILAPLVFIAMLIYCAYVFFTKMPYKNLKQSLLLIVVGSSLLIITIHSLVSFPLRLMQTGILFWFLLGVINRGLSLNGNYFKIESEFITKYRVVIKMLVICVLVVLIILNFFKFISDRNLADGWQSNNVTEKIKHYKQAIKFNPYNGRSRKELGKVYLKSGLNQKAYQQFNLAQKSGMIKEIYNEIGVIYINKGLHFKAIKNFKKAISFCPNTIDPYVNLAIINKNLAKDLIAQQKLKPGIKRLGKALLYWEQCKVMLNMNRKDAERISFINEINNYYLPKVINLFLRYIDKYPAKQLKVNYEFCAPEGQLPLIDILEKKVVDGKEQVVMFIYTKDNYQSLLKERGIFVQDNKLVEGISDFKEYILGNVRVIMFKKSRNNYKLK